MAQMGDFGVVCTGGFVAWVIRRVTASPVNHAILYGPNGMIIEATPQKVLDLANHYNGVIDSDVPLTPAQRSAIWAWGLKHVGTPYNFLDIAALFVSKTVSNKLIPGFVKARLSTDQRMICSQLVDAAYHECGIELFTDDRLAGSVTPGDLYDVITKGNQP